MVKLRHYHRPAGLSVILKANSLAVLEPTSRAAGRSNMKKQSVEDQIFSPAEYHISGQGLRANYSRLRILCVTWARIP